LVDAHHCSDPAKFISVLLVTLSTMVQLEMPQVRAHGAESDTGGGFHDAPGTMTFHRDVEQL
jgi:hypothetical protein